MTAYVCERFDVDAQQFRVGIFPEKTPAVLAAEASSRTLHTDIIRLSIGKADTPWNLAYAVATFQFFESPSMLWLPLACLAFQGTESYNSRPPHPRPWTWDPDDPAGMPGPVEEAIAFLRTDYVSGRMRGPGSWEQWKARMRARLEQEWKDRGRWPPA